MDGNRNGEIIFSIWNQHGVLAELLQNHICQVVGTAELYCRFRSGEHIKYLGLMGVQVDALERFCALSWLWIDSDVLHSVNAEMAEFLAVVGIEIVISVVPQKPKRTDNIGFIVVRIPLFLFAVIVEILEAHFAVGLNGDMKVVCVLYHAVIHTADTACDERPAVQTGAGIAVCQEQDLCLCCEKT